MVSQIDKDRSDKRMRMTYLIIIAVFYVYFLLVLFHVNAIMYDDPRASFSEALNTALLEVFSTKMLHMRVTGQMLTWVVAMTAMGGTFGVMFYNDKLLRKHDNPETVNGDAHFMNATELADYNKRLTDPYGKPTSEGQNNMILSKDVKLGLDGFITRHNCNVLIIGGSGAGKTRFFAAPNILQFNTNLVITDPSGEILQDYGKALEDNGYRVRVFNLSNVYEGNRYNPFHYIKEEKDVFILVNTLIKNTTPPDGHGSDPFWENSEKLLITALILYLWHVPDEKLRKEHLGRNFMSIMRMLDMAEVSENDEDRESKLDILFKELKEVDPENLACQNYHSFRQAAGKTMKSILISVNTRLQSFRLSDIQYLTNADEFEFEKFADTRQALFVIIPTADTTFNFIVSLMYSQLFTSLYDYTENRCQFGWEAYIDEHNVVRVEQAVSKSDSARAKRRIEKFVKAVQGGTVMKRNKERHIWEIYTKRGTLIGWRGEKKKALEYQASLSKLKIRQCPRRCPNHVRLILDEFANIGQIPDFDQKLSTIRKYEISCSIILQALSQLKELYDKKWNTIAANCDEKLFLGCDDQDTIEWLLKMLGKRTTNVENTSYQAGGNNGGSTSYNRSSIELMTVDQVTLMASDQCIVRVKGERPFFGKKYELTEHPNYAYAHKKRGTFVIETTAKGGHKKSGPLRERNKDVMGLIEEAEKEYGDEPGTTPAEGSVPVSSVDLVKKELHKNKMAAGRNAGQRMQNENRMRRENAKAAKGMAGAMDDMPDGDMEDMAKAIQQAFGIKPGASNADIKQSIETMIQMEHPSLASIKYNVNQS